MQFQSNSCTLAGQSGIQMIISLVACRLFHRTQALSAAGSEQKSCFQ